MNTQNKHHFRLLPIAAAILLAYSHAYAEESSEVQGLITPSSSVSVGVGSVNNALDAKRFAQYTGMNQSASLLLDFDINKREDATGLWTKFSGRNLGLDTRELNFSQSKQGDWKYSLEYNEIVRRDPYVIHTGMTGIGTTTPTINLIAQPAMPAAWATANKLVAPIAPAPANDVELKLHRTAIGVSGEKWITPELQFEVSFKNEDKKGARMFGRAGLDSADMGLRPVAGTGNVNGSWAILLTPEAVNSTTQQLEGKLNFNRDSLAVTGGYYGSFYVNNNGNMSPNVPGTLNRGALWNGGALGSSTVQQLASSPVALPPDNQAHQLYLSGNYAFSQTTRSTFKLSYTHATQNESFAAMGLGLGPSGQTSLGGVMDTKLAQFGLTMRPLKELSINASLRYEDRADKTPISIYNMNGVLPTVAGGVTTYSALNNTTNFPSGSQTRTTAKLEGVYRFASGYSVLLGGDWERKVIPLPPANSSLFANQVLFRPALNEYGLRSELRKAMSDTLNGAIGVEYKQRRGNDNAWVTTNPNVLGNPLLAFNPALATVGNRVLPDMYMDRDRIKLRSNLDWEASEKLSLQLLAEHTQDNYLRAAPSAIVPAQLVPILAGARSITGNSLSADATYLMSEDWRVSGFWTYSYNRWNVNKAGIGDDTRNLTHTLGVRVNGKATARLTLGMDILATRDTTTFNNVVATSAGGNIAGFNAAVPGNYLPSIHYTTQKLNLHAKYALDKVSDVQAVFAYQQFKTDDWQWGNNGVPFLYSDNTTVSQPMNQSLKFLGITYLLRF
jgi:MtrB/PioB family decaheme-associated outer membrane protein